MNLHRYSILDANRFFVTFITGPIFKPIFLNTENTIGNGTKMVYSRLHVLLIDIKSKLEVTQIMVIVINDNIYYIDNINNRIMK